MRDVFERSLVCVIVALAIPSPSEALPAVADFTGRVVEQRTGKPVAGAIVSVAGLPGTVVADDEGRFTITAAPTPPFQLIVISPGGHVAKPVLIERIDGDVLVRVDALADESVTVVGAAPSIDAAPGAATTLLSGLQVARRSPEHLLQALETVPGIGQVSEGHAGVPSIRGLARGRVLLLVDGARVTSERRVGPSATFLDPIAFAGVDVARGPGSVAYGSDALGGVISVRTKNAPIRSPLRVHAQATAGVGIPEGRGAVEVSRGFDEGGILIEGHARRAGDWDRPDGNGQVFNSGWQDGGVLVKGSHRLGSGLLTVGWQSDFGRDIERPRNNSQIVRFYYPYEDAHRFTAGYQLARLGGFDAVRFTAFLGTIEQRTDQDRFATATAGRSIERADVAAKDFHVKSTAARGLGPARLEIGLDVNGRVGLQALDIIQAYSLSGDLTTDTTNVSIEDAHRTDVGAFAQAGVAAGRKLRLSGGVRGDHVTTENSGGYFGDRSTAHGAFSGFAAATAGPFSGLTITAQLSRGFRDPTLSDRYFRGPSGRGFITGNPDLKPESSRQLDLNARYTVPRTQIGVSYYNYRIDDLIERYSTAADFFFFRNRGRGNLQGFEVETQSDVGRGLTLELGAHIGRGKLADDGSHLDDVSPDTFLALIRKEFSQRAYLQGRLALLADDDRPGPSEVASPGATIVDIAAGYPLTQHLELRGMLRNLLDDAYYASPDPRWVWAAGRSGNVTLVVVF